MLTIRMEGNDLESGFENKKDKPENTKQCELVLESNLIVKPKGITLNNQPLENYEKGDLKYVESKVRKAINEKQKSFYVDNLLVFTTLADRIVQAVIDMLHKMKKE